MSFKTFARAKTPLASYPPTPKKVKGVFSVGDPVRVRINQSERYWRCQVTRIENGKVYGYWVEDGNTSGLHQEIFSWLNYTEHDE